jgi:aldehyde:ferredoxin oxidoreductase
VANGYMGKVLWVDLSKGTLRDEILDEKLCREYIGGYGFGARKLFTMMQPGSDPLGAGNILGFMTGPLTGTRAISASRYTVFCKSPLTQGWGDANSGGDFGPGLKFGGYDGVCFTGISEKPVYLYIENGKAELKDASDLWGKDTFDTEDTLKSIHGKDAYTCCIGPSGENLSLISAIMNNYGRAAARSGVGAVMGSKRLKAIAVNGNQQVPVANPALLTDLRKRLLLSLNKSGWSPFFRTTGTAGAPEGSALSGDSPVKNWGGAYPDDFSTITKISGTAIIDKQQKKYGCYMCPLACGGHMKAGTEYEYKAGAHKPEYETLCGFGTMCLNDNAESIIKANDICNRAGLDTISVSGTVAFAIECYENGIITKEDTGGIEMKWGNHGAIVAMTDLIARRRGFGAVLADGVKVAAERIGKGSEKYAIHIGGQELPMHDPKKGYHFYTTYVMDATPARHMQGETNHPPGVWNPYDAQSFTGRGDAHLRGAALTHVQNCAGTCSFVYFCLEHINDFIETVNAITGWETNLEELVVVGDRIGTIRHAFNLREGINPLQLKIPGRMVGKPALTAGPLKGIAIDEETLLRDYLNAEDWDLKTAMPSKSKMMSLDLEDVAETLYHKQNIK